MSNQNNKDNMETVAMRVCIVSIFGNTILSLIKLLAGVIAHSGAMVSDAVHSASDVFSSIIVIVGVKLSAQASDKEHHTDTNGWSVLRHFCLQIFCALPVLELAMELSKIL